MFRLAPVAFTALAGVLGIGQCAHEAVAILVAFSGDGRQFFLETRRGAEILLRALGKTFDGEICHPLFQGVVLFRFRHRSL